jgi:hypothetical protein
VTGQNRAAQLVNDLHQILLFVDRELSRIEPRSSSKPDADEPYYRSVESPREAWREGLVRNGPWLVSLTLGALMAVELARASAFIAVELVPASIKLFGGGVPPAPLPTVVMDTRALERPDVDVQSIVAAKLFGVFAADPNSQDPSGTPRTAADLLLAGTLATENPKTGLAIISDAGPAQVYEVGASVGDASLHSVYRDRVVLSRNGRLETLALPKLSTGKGKLVAAAPAKPRMAELEEPASVATLRPDRQRRGFRLSSR